MLVALPHLFKISSPCTRGRTGQLALGLAEGRKQSCSTLSGLGRISVDSPEQLHPDSLQQTAEPVIITGALLQDWPLLQSWTPQFVAQKFGNVQIPVERSIGGADYRDAFRTQDNPGSATLPTKHFESNHLVPLLSLLGRSAHGQTAAASEALYLAQNDLCEYIPDFRHGLGSQPEAALGHRLIKRNMWLGPRGASTPLHHDPYNNIFVQVWGIKAVTLFAAREAGKLYPHEARLLHNTSQVDAAHPDYDKHPKFRDARGLHGSLKPGEMLWMPKGWWHFLRAETASLSVSYWWL